MVNGRFLFEFVRAAMLMVFVVHVVRLGTKFSLGANLHREVAGA